MVSDTIQLGAKKPQGKSLSDAKLRGFFYGGSDFSVGELVYALIGTGLSRRGYYSAVIKRRQHLILQTICRQRPRLFILLKSYTFNSKPCLHLFYDNPSRKRDSVCTNIPHTGALSTVKGVGQRLRKGFRGGSVYETQQEQLRLLITRWVVGARCQCRGTHFESLSSAAKLRHSARNTRL